MPYLSGVATPRDGTWQANQARRIWRPAASESLQYVLPMVELQTMERETG